MPSAANKNRFLWRRHDVWIDRWATLGIEPATIRNRMDPVRTIYRRALVRDLVTINPTLGLEVPKVNNARERFATREEAAVIATLPSSEQAIWATAFYGVFAGANFARCAGATSTWPTD